ncbi:MAG TPA: hypothetical protein VMJ32_08675 [Pirellulales bacterium]|nr:hypothetical protein [Pirellulales bacterium]
MLTVPRLEDILKIEEPDSDENSAAAEAPGIKLPVKPLPRVETALQPALVVGVIAAAALVFALAFALRNTAWKSSPWVLLLGALALAPPLVVGGYTFLRDQELEPYQGRELAARAAICAAVYVVLWGVLWGLKHWFLPNAAPLESWSTLFLVGPLLAIGTLSAVLSLDLDAGNGFFHYCLYVGVCVLLRLTMGLPAL